MSAWWWGFSIGVPAGCAFSCLVFAGLLLWLKPWKGEPQKPVEEVAIEKSDERIRTIMDQTSYVREARPTADVPPTIRNLLGRKS